MQIAESAILDQVHPLKDVDAFHPDNVGRLVQGRPRFVPCTPHGVQQMLHRAGVEVAGKHVVVVGRSDIVGKPLALLLMQRDSTCGPTAANASVTICHSRTKNLGDVVKQADIIVAAVGRPNFVQGDWIKPGAVVMDACLEDGTRRELDSFVSAGGKLLVFGAAATVGPDGTVEGRSLGDTQVIAESGQHHKRFVINVLDWRKVKKKSRRRKR